MSLLIGSCVKNNQYLVNKITLTQTVRFLLVFVFVTVVFGCSIMPNSNIKNIADMQSPTELSVWTARGKMMIASGSEKVSGYFYWQQNNQDFKFSLNTLIGINMFELSVANGQATLVVDGNTYKDDTAENLVYKLTGYRLPISQLRWWVLGVIDENPQAQSQQLILAQTNQQNSTELMGQGDQVKSLSVGYNNQTWQIDYQSWQQVLQFSLPKSMQLKSVNNRIKLSFSDWALQG